LELAYIFKKLEAKMKKGFFLIISFVLFSFNGIFPQIALIANKDINESIQNKNELYNLITLEKVKWATGEQIAIYYNNNDTQTNEKFFEHFGIKFLDAKKIWLKKTLTGEAKAPKTINDYNIIINLVAETKGAIAIVPKDKVKGNVKILYEIN